MLKLIINASVYAPEPVGCRQVLIAGERIQAVAERIDVTGAEIEIIDARGAILLPGIVDALTHPAGGGGEGGFSNRTAEVSFEAFVDGGVTSPIGALGTDSITRSLDVLYGSVMSLRERGLDAYMYTGSYRVPANTLTGDIARDLTLIDPVVGVGEVAISDHRSSQPTVTELRRIAADARLGGVIAGKGGVVFTHVGDGATLLQPILDALEGSELPVTSFYPTHVNRSLALFDTALHFANRGGYIDVTASSVPEFVDQGEIPPLQALTAAAETGVAHRVSLSSDAGGSLPVYRDGELCGLQAAGADVLLALLQRVLREQPDLCGTAVAAMTRNPASALGLKSKGRIAPDFDADFLMLDPDSFALRDVVCQGRHLMRQGTISVEDTNGGIQR